MTKEELQIRIDKKNKDIEKIQKRIVKWTKGMNDEAKTLASACEITSEDSGYKSNWQALRNYNQINGQDSTVNNQDDWNKGPNLREAANAYNDLAIAKVTLKKYQDQLSKLNNYIESEKIKVIWNFLMNWRKEAYQYYVQNVKLYKELKGKYDEELEKFMTEPQNKEFIENAPINRKQIYKMHLRNTFYDKYYLRIENLTKMISNGFGTWDDEKLNKILDKDVQSKYENFKSKIEEKAGKIEDVNNLYIGPKGDINGYVIGDKNKVNVETISAGGYNIQRLHYRTLVNIVK